MTDFRWYLHEIVTHYMKGKYPDIKVNYSTFAAFFEKNSSEYEKLFSELGKKEFETQVKKQIESEVDRIMNERFLDLRSLKKTK